MSLESNYSSRTAEHHVRGMLEQLGYDSLRVLHATYPIHLIAWKDRSPTLLIQVRRRRSFPSARAYQENLKELVRIAREGNLPGEIQLWMKTRRTWVRYAVSPYGAMPLSWGRADES
jgi:hypothetical protein